MKEDKYKGKYDECETYFHSDGGICSCHHCCVHGIGHDDGVHDCDGCCTNANPREGEYE